VLRNNIFADGIIDECSPTTVTNNVFISGGGPPASAQYNAFVNVSPTGSNTVSSTLSALFVDAASGDYHPKPGSPALGAGKPSGCPPDDVDGNPRTPGVCNIGPY
jgi:hypothetical protein